MLGWGGDERAGNGRARGRASGRSQPDPRAGAADGVRSDLDGSVSAGAASTGLRSERGHLRRAAHHHRLSGRAGAGTDHRRPAVGPVRSSAPADHRGEQLCGRLGRVCVEPQHRDLDRRAAAAGPGRRHRRGDRSSGRSGPVLGCCAGPLLRPAHRAGRLRRDRRPAGRRSIGQAHRLARHLRVPRRAGCRDPARRAADLPRVAARRVPYGRWPVPFSEPTCACCWPTDASWVPR